MRTYLHPHDGPPQTPRSELSLYPVTPSSDPALGRIRAEPVALAPRAVAHTAARATAIPARLVDTLPRPASPLARRLTAQGESPGGAVLEKTGIAGPGYHCSNAVLS